MFKILSLVSVWLTLVTGHSDQLRYYVHDRPTPMGGVREYFLFAADPDAVYSHKESQRECIKLKMTGEPLTLPVISKALAENEFWVPFSTMAGRVTKPINGGFKTARDDAERNKKLGFLCARSLQGAIVYGRNGTSYRHRNFVPTYCNPQAELSEDELDELGVAMCSLLM